MRIRMAAVLAFGLLTLILVRPFGLPAQEPPPVLCLMGDFLIDVSRVAEYESALKDLLAALNKHGFSVRFDTYTTDDSHYYLIYGIEDYAGVDRWRAAWSDLAQKMGPGAVQAIHRRMAAAELERDYRF